MHESLKTYSERIYDLLNPQSNQDSTLISKGLVLYRQGMVTRTRLTDELLQAIVQDVARVQVQLDLNFPSNSTCSCPATGLCRHQLAAFFAAYSKEDSVSAWVEEWKSKHGSGDTIKQSLGLINRQQKPLRPERSVTAWLDFFKNVAEEELKEPPSFMVGLDRSASSYQRAIQRSEPENRQWVPLYRSMAYFYGLRYLFTLASRDLHHNQEEIIEAQIEELLFAFSDEVDRFENSIRPFDSEEFIAAWFRDTEKLADGDSGTFFYYKWQIYRKTWSTIITSKEERKAERKRLLHKLESLNDFTVIELVTWMLIHLYMIEGNDSDAFGLMKRLGSASCYQLVFLLDDLYRTEQYTRMIPFVEFFTKQIREYLHDFPIEYKRTQFVYNALQIIRPFSSETKRFDLLERFLREAHPYSFIPYSHYLFEKKDYKKWVELQMVERVNVTWEWSEQLKVIQKEHPEYLLPIYHSEVTRLVNEKNRPAYREAVRCLKKLRTIYKKMKQINRWEAYLAHLRESTRRLRAFQEELKKGKLVDAVD